jgi:nucleotide-binding universal stress UspA family protein
VASDVRVIRFAEEKDAAFPDTRLLDYLSRHAIHAELDTRAPPAEFGAGLIEYASKAGATYLVMGAYSHTRAGEFLFGGVTRELLRACPIPLVMAH